MKCSIRILRERRGWTLVQPKGSLTFDYLLFSVVVPWTFILTEDEDRSTEYIGV